MSEVSRALVFQCVIDREVRLRREGVVEIEIQPLDTSTHGEFRKLSRLTLTLADADAERLFGSSLTAIVTVVPG